ncbi:MAG: pilus assembly protein PilM [Patescibacteria group bacterium]|nr:pilus assembly protein PilM [Patescibacteria group bacterium]
MSLFGGDNKLSYLGVDLGNAGIKIVELRNENGRPHLVTYGLADMSIDAAGRSAEQTEEEIVELVRQICVKAGTISKKAISSLPSFSVFSSVITLPEMKEKELDKAIVWEAKKFLPMNVEEMNLDWKIIDKYEGVRPVNRMAMDSSKTFDNETVAAAENSTGEKKEKEGEEKTEAPKVVATPITASSKSYLKILVTAAPKKNVARYIGIFKRVGLELLGLETESFALERALVGFEEAPVMIVDIGAITSDLIIVEKGIPVLSRSVDAGGATITQTIRQGLNVDLKRAEQFKRDIGFKTGSSQGIPKVIENSIEPIINEIKYCFDLYLSQEEKGKRIEKIVLTGGSAFLPNLPEFLEKLLNIKVIIGDPWARIVYPMELKPVLDELAPRMAVAVGLAMREIE